MELPPKLSILLQQFLELKPQGSRCVGILRVFEHVIDRFLGGRIP